MILTLKIKKKNNKIKYIIIINNINLIFILNNQ